MNNPETSTDESLVEQLAEEYLARLQNGERPSIRQYTEAHPGLAEEIRDLFNTLVMMEDLAPDPDDLLEQSLPSPAETPANLGEYRILRELGRGGMGVVYEAEHTSMRRRVALKVLHVRSGKQGHDLERFMREARSAGRLHHTNIVPVFEVGSDDGTHFYAMQCIRGQNLDLIVADLKQIQDGRPHQVPRAPTDTAPSAAYGLLSGNFTRNDIDDATASVEQPLDSVRDKQVAGSSSDSFTNIALPDSSEMSSIGARQENYFHRVARVGLQVADALSYAHEQGILHRDIKPSNLILDTAGIVWVTDFGLAHSEGEDLTHTGDIVGTLRYMAPERFQGQADARADIYSLGLTLYELCTLKHAFDRSDRAELIRQVTQQNPTRPRLVNASIPADLETIVLKAMEREPNARYRSAGEMAEDLRLFLADRPIQARRASYTEQVWRWCRRNPAVASMLASIAMLLAVLFCGSIAFAVTTQRHVLETERHSQQLQEKTSKVQAAHLVSQRSLFQAHVDRAKASRWSGRRGQRFDTLESVKSAAELLPVLEYDAERVQLQKQTLRNEVVAALPLVDMRMMRSWPADTSTRCGLSDDGKLVAIPDASGQVTIYESDSDRVVAGLQGPQENVWVMRFDPTSRYLATWYHNVAEGLHPRLIVWEIATERKIIDLKKRLDSGTFDFDDSGQKFAIPRDRGHIDIIRLDDPREVLTYRAPKNRRGARFASNGDIATMVGKQIIFFDAEGQQTDRSLTFPGKLRSFEFVADGDVLGGCDDKKLYIHEAATGNLRRFDGHTGSVSMFSASSDGQLLVSEAWGGTRFLRSLHNGEVLLELGALYLGWGGFSTNGTMVPLSEPMNLHALWEVTTGGPYRKMELPSLQKKGGIAAHPFEESLAVVTGENLEVWDVERSKRLAVHKDIQAFDVRFAPSGDRLYLGFAGNAPPQTCTISVIVDDATGHYSVELGDLQAVDGMNVTRQGGRGQHIVVDRSSTRVAAFDRRNNVRVVDLTGDREPVTIDAQLRASRLDISQNGKLIAVGTWHGRGVNVYDAESGDLLQEMAADLTSAFVAFSPDGNWLVASGNERDVRWDTQTWTAKTITGDLPDNGTCRIAISPDSRLAAIAHSSFVRRLIDLPSGQVIAVLEGPDPVAANPVFSATGRYVFEACDGQIQIWDLHHLRTELDKYGLDWE